MELVPRFGLQYGLAMRAETAREAAEDDRKEPLERRGFSSAARKSQASDNMIFMERTLPRSGTTPPDRRCLVDCSRYEMDTNPDFEIVL